MDWKRILGTTVQKIKAIFVWPVFMVSFLPITFFALFRKFEWTPIAHTVAIGSTELNASSRRAS